MEKENSESEDSENFSFHPNGYGWRRSVGRHSQEYEDFITCFLTEVAKRKGINPEKLVTSFFPPISSQPSQQNETTPSESQEQAASEERVNSGIVRVYSFHRPEFIPPSPFETKQRYGRYTQPKAQQEYPPDAKVHVTGFQAVDLKESASYAVFVSLSSDDGQQHTHLWGVTYKRKGENEVHFDVPIHDFSRRYEALATFITGREKMLRGKIEKDIPIFVG